MGTRMGKGIGMAPSKECWVFVSPGSAGAWGGWGHMICGAKHMSQLPPHACVGRCRCSLVCRRPLTLVC